MSWKVRIAPSLGEGFSGTPKKAWGTQNYEFDLNEPTVFFGLYGLPDFFALWRHKGRRCILWCGSDITNFVNGYWLDGEGKIKLNPAPLAEWISKNCESYVENEVEQKALQNLGIESKVVPSFLGNVHEYKISYERSEKPKVYTSVSGDEFKLYGWHKLEKLAQENPDVEFHCYGNEKVFDVSSPNIIMHKRVSQKVMDNQTSKMQGALRLTDMDGFSEIIAKSLLWGQWPISPFIDYPFVLKDIKDIKNKKVANMEGRQWLLSVVNKFPWNTKS